MSIAILIFLKSETYEINQYLTHEVFIDISDLNS